MSTTTAAPGTTGGGYSEENMKTLKDAAHIRQNPGMYVGNTDTEGLHHLVYEIVYNSVDEALAGYCKHISVALHVDGSISVSDDGRGIPVGVKADTGKSTLEEALTIAGTSGKFDNAAYRVSAGLHGMGAKAMNALSEWCLAEVRREGRVYQMEFERGYATSALKDIGPTPAGQTGTTISFKPDPEMFGDLTFDFDKLATRFLQLSFLNRGLTLALRDDRDGKAETYFSNAGITDYVVHLNLGEQVEHAPIYLSREINGVTIEVCLQYNGGDNKIEMCFTNNAYNKDGGTHLSGFRAGLTRSVTTYGRKEGHFKDGLELKGEDFREGLTAVISVSHPDPSFESQTKVKLVTAEVEGQVSSVVYEALSEFLEKNPKEGTRICKKIALSAEARLAAKKARDAIIDRKKILGGGGLPGKLMDCTTREREKSELFLVEGDSAGGSAESGRDRMYQAVLPLRGKVLNVEKARLEKLLKNEEIASLIAAVGVDIGNIEDVTKVRYGKIIILTDADVDGQHIRTLLLTFFFRQMRKLIEDGHLFVARPPLFKVTQKKEVRFVKTRAEMVKELFARGMKDTSLVVYPVGARQTAEYPKTIGNDILGTLIPMLDEVEAAVVILERRGQTFDSFLSRVTTAGFPRYHVRLGTKEFFFNSQEEVETFRAQKSTELGRELVISDEVMATGLAPATPPPSAGPDGSRAAAPAPVPAEIDERYRFTVDEWHEVRALNRALVKLQEAGFTAADLVPLPRLAGREPAVRFALQHGESRKDLDHLRELVAEVRKLGEKGLTITRFKGLGEMDPEELWDTTLDPEHRTLLRVTLENGFEAEKWFRKLMGDEVEGRREYILKHRIDDPESIDYGA
ncbi:DNA gyrase subunit B [Fimbriiglobus ruber]|uniref:DNA topoisomerase (ATP-hydrolyzing) n=1 Tax=Fimbriiglobus ruber TaxID=1908690 RepID=A0A225E3M6_9BACT|nr:DNA gyrase subunit B [Fimbriiglobus ruber]OWK45398.1 DNA gyrase subunit B [Fimbriiglobus ruber]